MRAIWFSKITFLTMRCTRSLTAAGELGRSAVEVSIEKYEKAVIQ